MSLSSSWKECFSSGMLHEQAESYPCAGTCPGMLTAIYSSFHPGSTKQTSCYAALANRSSLCSVCWHGWTNFSVCFLHQDVWNLKNNYIFQVMTYWWSSWYSGKKEVAEEKKYLNFTSAPLEKWQREPFPPEAFGYGAFQYLILGLSEAQKNLKGADDLTFKRCDKINIRCHTQNNSLKPSKIKWMFLKVRSLLQDLQTTFVFYVSKIQAYRQQAPPAYSSRLAAVRSTTHKVTFVLTLAAKTGDNNATNSLPCSINPRMHSVIKHTSHQSYHISIKHCIKSPVNTRAVRTR